MISLWTRKPETNGQTNWVITNAPHSVASDGLGP
jgi:hypothetical protein